MELPRLTVLNEQYAIRRLLGEVGPFEAVYLAWDLENEKQVIVHEFLPESQVDRVLPSQALRPNSNEARTLVEMGVKNLSKELALRTKISHPNVIQVLEFFKENNTLYSIHEYHPGTTLQQVLDHNDGKMSAKTAITIMMPFMDGVRVGHNSRMIHGRISPDSVFLSKKGRPMVMSFNTTFLFLAGKLNGEHSVQIRGFSPPEQYSTNGKHGPWSDVYGCAATIFTMLTGEILPDAHQRQHGDSVKGIIEHSSDLPDELKEHLIAALSLDTNKRPHKIAEFSNALAASLSIEGVVSVPSPEKPTKKNLRKPPSDFQAPVPPQPDIRSPKPQDTNGVFFDETVGSSPSQQNIPQESVTFDQIYSTSNGGSKENGNGSSHYENPVFTPALTDSASSPASPAQTFEDLNLKPVGKQDNLPARSTSYPSVTKQSGIAQIDPYKRKKTYEQIDPVPTFEYNSNQVARGSKTGHIVLYTITTGLLFALTFFAFRYFNPAPATSFNSDVLYADHIARGDSMYNLAFNAANSDSSFSYYKKALENYYASQSITKDPQVRRRIVDIEEYLETTPVTEQQLDQKASLAIIAAGDSLLRVAERISLQGDSVQANVLYAEARQKYFTVFEAFPDDSLANSRLRMVNNLMTAPAKAPTPEPQPQPVAAPPTDQQIQEKLFILFKDQGDAALSDRNYDEARRKYIDALKQKPGDPEVARLLEETQRALANSLRRQKYREHMKNGNTLLEQDRLNEARREFELALQSWPQDDDAKQQIFVIETRLKDNEKRQKDYLSFRTRGDLLLEQKKYEEALASYLAALDAMPDDEYALAKIQETERDIESIQSVKPPDLPPGMVDESGIYNYTEQPPELIGGLDVLQSRIRYPAAAMNANVEGRVVIQMLVDETGQMSSPTVIKSLGYGCDEEALRVIRGARFEPARVGGRPVPSWHRMFFEFTQ